MLLDRIRIDPYFANTQIGEGRFVGVVPLIEFYADFVNYPMPPFFPDEGFDKIGLITMHIMFTNYIFDRLYP